MKTNKGVIYILTAPANPPAPTASISVISSVPRLPAEYIIRTGFYNRVGKALFDISLS